MLSHSTKALVAQLIQTVANTEIESESVRQLLCQKVAFEPYAAFRQIAQFSSVITSQRLRIFLAENDVKVSKQAAHFLVRLFDSNGDGRLSYEEFVNALLPKRDAKLSEEAQARNTSNYDDGLPHHVENTIARVFEEEYEAFKTCEKIRQELAQLEDFTIMNAFRELDVNDAGYIDVDKLITFMENANQPLKREQLEAFMVKVDKKLTGLIRYSEFLEVFYSNEIEDINEKEEDSPIKRSPQKLIKPERYIDNQRTSYASPKKTSQGHDKVLSLNGSYLSPQNSTKMSIAYSPSQRSPTKLSASRLEPDYLTTSMISQNTPKMRTSFYSVNMSPMKESPMKKKEENELVKALREMVENVRALEIMKNNLALLEDFNVYNSFAIFDTEVRGSINSRDLEIGFNKLNIKVTKGDIALLMKRIDTDLDGVIRYEDWSQVTFPRSGQYAKVMTYKDPNYVTDLGGPLDAFSPDTMEEYRSFLMALVDQEILHESIRQRLLNRKTFNLHDAFKALDRYDSGIVTADQFKEYLEDNNIFSSQKDVNTLVERYAKGEKGKISYYDFVKEMTPKSVDRY